MRVAVIVAGVVLGLGSLIVSGLYTLIIGVGCSGTDAGEPPSADSIGHALCDSPALPVGLVVLGLGATVAPVWGGAIAARAVATRRCSALPPLRPVPCPPLR